jgi:hypothetical protein
LCALSTAKFNPTGYDRPYGDHRKNRRRRSMTSTIVGSATAMPMTADVLAAYADVQNRLLNANSLHLVERYERTLNELLANPNRTGLPHKLVNAAYGNAGKVIRSRARRTSNLTVENELIPDQNAQAGYLQVRLKIFIDRSLTSERDRQVADLLLHGYDGADISATLGITENNANVVISRVRKRARTLWE